MSAMVTENAMSDVVVVVVKVVVVVSRQPRKDGSWNENRDGWASQDNQSEHLGLLD